MWWSPNTIKPNPLSSLIFLKQHHLTLFPYYHPAKIQNFPILLPQKKNPIKSSISFTLRDLSKQKTKKSWVALCKVCFIVWLPRNRGNHLVSILFFSFFFKFWFLYWISYRIVKKDRSFIVFWDWIGMWNQIIFLGFIWFLKRLNLRSNLCVYVCLRDLSKQKTKKRWVALCKVCFTVWLSRNRGNHLVSIFSFLYFFIFWFLYWISYRIVKIDRNFIVFWDWIGMWNRIIFLGFVWFLKRLNLKSNLCVFACFLGAFGLV